MKRIRVPHNVSVPSKNHLTLPQEIHNVEAITERPEEEEGNPMKNPLTIPSDTELFAIRDQERKKAKEEYERMKTLKVHEKTTYSTKIKAKSGLRIALKREEEEENRKQATSQERMKALQKILSWKLGMQKENAFEKETFHGYMNDRREICFLEYAMAVKRDEIKKMESIAQKEEKKLEKAEKRMEKDAAMFDELLRDNHNNSFKALKMAKEETLAKIKKKTEIRAINSQIEKVKSDISRIKDTLQEYKMYRDILYQLSPKEWQEEHRKKHTKKKDLKTESGDQGLTTRTNTAHSTSFIDLPTSLLSSENLDFGSHDMKIQLKDFLKPLLTTELSPSDDAESEISSDEDEEPELYFTHPTQLLATFTEMQDENISLIHKSQDVEECWNKAEHTFITTHESMEKQLAELKQQVNTLRSSVAKEEEKVEDLKAKVQLFSCEEQAGDQDKMLTSLDQKVQEVYYQCTGDNEADLQTVEMLKAIEKKLNNLLDNLEGISPSKIVKAQRAIKKEWRTRKRAAAGGLKTDQATAEKKNAGRLVFHSNLPARKKKNQDK